MVSGDIASVLKPPAARCLTTKASEPLWTQSFYQSDKHGRINGIQEFPWFPDLVFYCCGSVFSTYARTEHIFFKLTTWRWFDGHPDRQPCWGRVIPQYFCPFQLQCWEYQSSGTFLPREKVVSELLWCPGCLLGHSHSPWHVIFAFCFRQLIFCILLQ